MRFALSSRRRRRRSAVGAAAFGIILLALSAAPAMADSIDQILQAQLKAQPGATRIAEMVNTPATVASAPPAAATATVGTAPAATSPVTGHGAGGAPTLANGTRCQTKLGVRTCTTTKNNRVVRSCVTRKGVLTCEDFAAGHLTKRCVTKKGVKTCTTFNKQGKPLRRCVTKKGKTTCAKVRTTTSEVRLGESLSPLFGASVKGALPAVGSLSWHGWPASVVPAVGRLYASIPNSTLISQCSATVVTRTLLLTAAHCITHNGAYDTGVLFIPGQTWGDPANADSIQATYGIWQGNGWWVPEAYLNGSDPNMDWGLVEIAPSAGSYISDFTGTFGITANISYNPGARIYTTGYPIKGWFGTAAGYHGRGQYACDTRFDPNDGWYRNGGGWELWVPCWMSPGSSGGPSFVQLSDNSWTIGGVINRCWGPNMNTDDYCAPWSYWGRSSYMNDDFLTFWNGVQPLLTYR